MKKILSFILIMMTIFLICIAIFYIFNNNHNGVKENFSWGDIGDAFESAADYVGGSFKDAGSVYAQWGDTIGSFFKGVGTAIGGEIVVTMNNFDNAQASGAATPTATDLAGTVGDIITEVAWGAEETISDGVLDDIETGFGLVSNVISPYIDNPIQQYTDLSNYGITGTEQYFYSTGLNLTGMLSA